MATTKILVVRNHLSRALDYVTNPKKTAVEYEVQYAINPSKTEQLLYCDTINCRSVKTASAEMQRTKEQFSKQGGVLAYHFIQSFAPGESTPAEVHAIGVEFANRCFGEKYQVVIATHLNCDHLHNHIVVNSVGCFDGKKYHSNASSYYEQIRATSDRICREHGLSVIEEPQGKGKSYDEQQAEKQGQPTMRSMIRADVDMVLAKSINWQTFVIGMRKIGYEVQFGANRKYATIKHIKGSRTIRLKSLGEQYTEEAIRQRFEQKGNDKSVKALPAEKSKQPSMQQPAIFAPSHSRKFYRSHSHNYHKAKIKGFMALYYRYVHLLGKAKRKKTSRRCYYLLREDFLKFDRYLEQSHYLWEHNIESSADLDTAQNVAQEKILLLEAQRKVLHKQQHSSSSAELTEQIKQLTAQLRVYRKEVSLCGEIAMDADYLRQQLAEAQKEELRQQEEQHKKEMRYHEQRR